MKRVGKSMVQQKLLGFSIRMLWIKLTIKELNV